MVVSAVFEVSWEVCNKVGGIYTVVKSKAESLINSRKLDYYLIGPYFQDKSAGEFEEQVPPENLKKIFADLRNEGITCHYGTWLIAGEPKTILIDYNDYAPQKDNIKKLLWEKYKVDSLNSQFHDFDEPVIWATSAGKLIEKLANDKKKKYIAHFHEWLSGPGLLYLKSINAPVGTVFTTHATMLGRTLSGSGMNIYSELNNIDANSLAYKHGVHSKHQVESASAKNADVFTTVSEITGIEATSILGRKPDVLLLNGIDMRNFPTIEDAAIMHNLYKGKMKEFTMSYFFPYYHFDIDNTIFMILSGRYEFHTKGIDVFIQALGKINDKLKKEKFDKTIVSFIFVPAGVRGIKPEIMESRSVFDNIKETIEDDSKDIINRLVFSSLIQKTCNEEYILGKKTKDSLRKELLKFKKQGNPPTSTHDLHDEQSDPIINAFRANGLTNSAQDKVKVIFYPIYLTGSDKLLNTSYNETLLGAHLGVFPSFYEPWGYTPVEAAASLTSSITTDLAGFGRFIKDQKTDPKLPGIYIIDAMDKKFDEVVSSLTTVLDSYVHLSKEDRIKNKIEAKKLAQLTDWNKMIGNYLKAYDLAVEKRWN